MKILVLGAAGSAGINFINCLTRSIHPFEIHATDMNAWHLHLIKPYVKKSYITVGAHDPEWAGQIGDLIDEIKPDLVHAQPDIEVDALSAHRVRLGAPVMLPLHSDVKLAHDKLACQRRLNNDGVAVPKSWRGGDLDDAFLWAHSTSNGSMWVRARRGAGSRCAFKANSVSEAWMWMHLMTQQGKVDEMGWMISEYLPGIDYAFQSVWHNGELIVSAARKRLEYLCGFLSPTGQSSSPTVAVSVHNEAVNTVSIQAIRSLSMKPHGIYCVDLKENTKGVPCVTEINVGRFFTTSNFFAAAGCNMPEMYTRLGMGLAIEDQPHTNAVSAGMAWVRIPDGGPILLEASGM